MKTALKQKTLLCLVCMLLLSHLLAGCTTAGQYETATTVPIQTTPAVMPTQPTPAAPTAPPPAPESSVAFETNKAGKTVVHVTGPIDERPAYNYVFNPHVCSSICKLCLGDEVEAELNAYCDAVLAGADSFPCTGAENWARVNAAKAEALPISIFVDLGESFDESLMQDGKYPLTYTVSKSEFSQITTEFQAQVAALIAAADLREGDTELERALKLFSSESLRCVYDYKTEEDFTIRGYQSNAYHVIMEGRGICQEFARRSREKMAEILLSAPAGRRGRLNLRLGNGPGARSSRVDGVFAGRRMVQCGRNLAAQRALRANLLRWDGHGTLLPRCFAGIQRLR